MRRFVEWDSLEIRVNGEKLNALVASFRVDPIERLEVRFENGLMRVTGSVRKFLSVPFEVQIGEILASGRKVRVPLRSVSAFGAIPIPKFLFGLMRDRLSVDLIMDNDHRALHLEAPQIDVLRRRAFDAGVRAARESVHDQPPHSERSPAPFSQ